MSRKKQIDKDGLIVGLFSLALILLGVLMYTVVVPMVKKVDFLESTKTYFSSKNDTKVATTTEFRNEVVNEVIATTSSNKPDLSFPTEKGKLEYIEVVDSCGPHFDGECLRVRSAPSLGSSVVASLRNGMVLRVEEKVEGDGIVWYKVIFDEWLRYPNRVEGDWYVAADFVKLILDEGDKTLWESKRATTSKSIVVSRSKQMLYAYEGEELFLTATTSTGLLLTPTPRGTFTVFKKTPSRYMQGPLPNLSDQQYYDLPGVPWNLYFTEGGAVIHGAYWHNSFGSRYSHGCVNLPPDVAYTLYLWTDLGTKVIIKD